MSATLQPAECTIWSVRSVALCFNRGIELPSDFTFCVFVLRQVHTMWYQRIRGKRHQFTFGQNRFRRELVVARMTADRLTPISLERAALLPPSSERRRMNWSSVNLT